MTAAQALPLLLIAAALLSRLAWPRTRRTLARGIRRLRGFQTWHCLLCGIEMQCRITGPRASPDLLNSVLEQLAEQHRQYCTPTTYPKESP